MKILFYIMSHRIFYLIAFSLFNLDLLLFSMKIFSTILCLFLFHECMHDSAINMPLITELNSICSLANVACKWSINFH